MQINLGALGWLLIAWAFFLALVGVELSQPPTWLMIVGSLLYLFPIRRSNP